MPVPCPSQQSTCVLDPWGGLTSFLSSRCLYPVQAMKKSVGLPVAVQCVALPWQEELCLRFMREVERLMTPEKRPS